jgi:hypothetical protein
MMIIKENIKATPMDRAYPKIPQLVTVGVIQMKHP